VLDFSSERLDAGRHLRTVQSPIELHCVASDVDDCAARDLTDLRDLDDLRQALLASSRLPLVGGEPVRFRGRRWLDGGLCEPVPLETALAAKATHALVLLTRPRGGKVKQSGGFAERLVHRRLRALNPALVQAYVRRPALYVQLTERVMAATDQPGSEPRYVMGITPAAGSVVPSRLDRDRDRLRAGAELGRRAAGEALTPLADRSRSA
jgi:predicted patatin/cPLA2 family phospholipase